MKSNRLTPDEQKEFAEHLAFLPRYPWIYHYYPSGEQLEAHWRDFSEYWDKLKEGEPAPDFPQWFVIKNVKEKKWRWECWLVDAFIDAHPELHK